MRAGKEIRLMWTLGHSRIEENNKADEEAKKAKIAIYNRAIYELDLTN